MGASSKDDPRSKDNQLSISTVGDPGQATTLPAPGSVPTTVPDRPIPSHGEAPDPLLGQLIAQRFEVEAFLGAGGMGRVYLARQVAVDRKVVLKFLRSRESRESELTRRFRREAKVISQLTCPNTIVLHDFGQTDDGQLFMAMEYLEGHTLGREIRKNGRIPPLRALAMALQILASLEEAHRQGMVHRDLKPENIMLVERAGTPDFVKVLDFGIAKVLGVDGLPMLERQEPTPDDADTEGPLTHHGAVFGSPGYMSPEQVRGEDVDHRSDLYSLGVILYQMLSGEMPVRGTSRVEVLQSTLDGEVEPLAIRRPDITLPRALDQLILSCLEQDPGRRPGSADTVAAQARAISAGLAARQQHEERALMELAGLAPRWSRYLRWLAPAAVVLMLGLLIWQGLTPRMTGPEGSPLVANERLFVSASASVVPPWLKAKGATGGVRVQLRGLERRERALSLVTAAVIARLADVPHRFDPASERQKYLEDLEQLARKLTGPQGLDLQKQLGLKTFWTRLARGLADGGVRYEYDAAAYSPELPAAWSRQLKRHLGELRYDRYKFLLDHAVAARSCRKADSLAVRVKDAIEHLDAKPAIRSRLEHLLKLQLGRCRSATFRVAP